ncbi:MAG: riboflavin synthase [Pirellulales bacterium]|nr:riboflavin synthase [Pirellulales bacterium]
MFTGLVEALATITEIRDEPPGKRVLLAEPTIAREAKIGDSIAINGCCLTVVSVAGDTLAFEAGSETLSRTNLGELVAGDRVNLERSLRPTDRLGGHFVSGHIDAVGYLAQRRDEGAWSHFRFRAPHAIMRYLAPKASIAVDGVSLTLVEVDDDHFSVALIPHTLAVTTLGGLSVGEAVNLETDLLAKYVERLLAWRA